MKIVLDWIKSNPFITGCAVVALIGFVGLGYVRFVMVPGFTGSATDELKQISNRQKQLSSVPVQVPNKDINAQPLVFPTVINGKVIEDVREIYSTIEGQYDQIKRSAVEVNSRQHKPLMLGGGEIWPDFKNTPAYVQSMVDYQNHFKALFDPNPNPWGMPQFRASGPPTLLDVNKVLSNTSFNFINSNGITSAEMLDQVQAEQLYAQQRVDLMALLRSRAQTINLYVTLPPEEDRFATPIEVEEENNAPAGLLTGGGGVSQQKDRYPEGYPFDVADWAFAETPPKPDQLWEGQVQLWIMRDITQAIATINRIQTGIEVVNDQGETVRVAANVLNSPIKRLLKLETLPGYVGLHTVGGVFEEDLTETGGFAISPGGGLGNTVGQVYPDPPLELQPKQASELADAHFGLSPTGHISNAAYDVRHTRLLIDIRWDELPNFIAELRKANFMNVIRADIEDVDEYEMMRKGYVYGADDVVRAELLIESLWFRDWTKDFMPKIVREKLLIDLPEGANLQQDQYDQPF